MLGRPGCHLCEQAREPLLALAAQAGTELAEVDIDSDERLLRSHLERIPVILVDGREICHFFVDSEAVRAALS